MKQNIQKMFKSRKTRLICVAIFLLGALLIGGYTLAYLSSKDEVSNRFQADDVEIVLLEPAWNATGAKEAEKLVPGSIIDKDPYVKNISENDVYVRMGIEISIGTKALKTTDTAYKKFIAIMCIDPSDDKGDPENLVSSISGLMNANQTASKNEHFVYKNGWFYYVDSNDSQKPYKVLHSGEATERLFYEMHFPILKKEYNGYFNKPFTITIVAQAVPAEAVTDFSKIDQVFDAYAVKIKDNQ